MEVVIFLNPDDVTRRAADLVQGLLAERPQAVLALPTGRTPLALYRELSARDLDFSQARTFNLDEYVGLGPEHPDSFASYMEQNFFRHVNLPPAQRRVPNGLASDLAAEARAYEEAIRAAGGLDLAILGLGEDGHIAFNEPSSSLGSRTRVMALHSSTRQANLDSFRGGPVPTHGLTMGVGTILEARRVLLLATGPKKATILPRVIEGPIASLVPATALQLHPQATALVDEAAARRLELKDYYRTAYPA